MKDHTLTVIRACVFHSCHWRPCHASRTAYSLGTELQIAVY